MNETFHPLKIGLIGYNNEQTRYGLKYLAENNSEQVKYITKEELALNDDTVIYALYNEKNAFGVKLDQIILFDDEKWNILEKRKDFIQHILLYTYGHSCVPDEYVVMKCEC